MHLKLSYSQLNETNCISIHLNDAEVQKYVGRDAKCLIIIVIVGIIHRREIPFHSEKIKKAEKYFLHYNFNFI